MFIFACSFASIAAALRRLSDCELTQAEFYEFFEFLLYWVLVLYLSFRAGIYGTKTGLFSRKIKFVIFACSFASIAAAHSRCPPVVNIL